MNPDELAKFTLDNKLGGDSEFIHRKAIYRYVHVGVYTVCSRLPLTNICLFACNCYKTGQPAIPARCTLNGVAI